MNRSASEILIVGGGAAGMSAALGAAEADNASITLVDDNPRLGGQIWRAELGKTKSPDALKLIAAVESGRIQIVSNAEIFALLSENCLAAETSVGRAEFEFEKLIIATGARERFLPFPGWTLPNVCGAAGLQALVKGGISIESKRIVVAGTGPLLFVVAEYLRSKGGRVIAVVEQAPSAKVNRFAVSSWRSPRKLTQAVALRIKLLGIPFMTGSWVTSAIGIGRLEKINISCRGNEQTIECDLLACGFHLVPNLELASLLGCTINNGFVAVDEFQRTSCENVFCAGEPTGIGGVEASLVEGRIAGLAAIGLDARARELFRVREKTSSFADALDRTFNLRDELRHLAAASTVICRCEDVEYERLLEFDSFRDAKLQTRCGMGSCQARVCGPATEFIFGWKPGSVRPPVFPVRMENL